MLKRLTVEGYRSFRQATIDLQPVTVLVGPNGAGKSNLAYALITLSHLLHEPLYPNARERTFGELGFDELTFAGKRGVWRFAAEFEDPDGNSSYEIEVGRDDQGGLRILREAVEEARKGRTPFKFDSRTAQEVLRLSGRNFTWPAPASLPVLIRGNIPVLPEQAASIVEIASQLEIVARFAPDPALMRWADAVKFQETASTGTHFPHQVRLLKERAGGPYDAVMKRVRSAMDFVEGVGVLVTDRLDSRKPRLEIEFKIRGLPEPIRAHGVSDGALLALFFAWLVEQDMDLLVVEELECSVHPYLYGEMLSWVGEMADKGRGQVILTTHSPGFLNSACAGRMERLRIVERSDEDGTVFHAPAGRTDEELQRIIEEYRDAPGTLWYTGTIGGVPNRP